MEEQQKFQFRKVFNKESVKKLAQRIKKNYSDFEKEKFIDTICSRLDELSFGERNKLIQDTLIEFLPDNFEKVVKILIDSLDERLEENGINGYEGFIIMPQTYVIERLGIDNFDSSMYALYEMTMRFSSEGAIRRFIEKYPRASLSLLKKWTNDPNVHVRRLVSEGTRPRLPLESPIKMFVKDPLPVIELLELLKDDKELYVQRSVANNLNDISKDNPEIVIKTLKEWKQNANKNRWWVIRHALRTLLKQGNKEALEILGYETPQIEVSDFSILSKCVQLNQSVTFQVKISSKKSQKLLLNYIIHFVKANGNTSTKTFRIASKKMKFGEEVLLKKNHPFKKLTTRKLYSGAHHVELVINGVSFGKKEFNFQNAKTGI